MTGKAKPAGITPTIVCVAAPEPDRAADDRRIAGKAGLPQVVADDHDRRRGRLLVVRRAADGRAAAAPGITRKAAALISDAADRLAPARRR